MVNWNSNRSFKWFKLRIQIGVLTNWHYFSCIHDYPSGGPRHGVLSGQQVPGHIHWPPVQPQYQYEGPQVDGRLVARWVVSKGLNSMTFALAFYLAPLSSGAYSTMIIARLYTMLLEQNYTCNPVYCMQLYVSFRILTLLNHR